MATPPPPSQPQQRPAFPEIEPTSFDLIIIGTSLPSSILGAAASTVSKTVLHLDPNPFYGSLFSSLPPSQLPTRHPIAAVDTAPLPPHLSSIAAKLALDVSGPRVLFCADKAVDLMLKSGVSRYMEFKGVDETLIFDGIGGGRLVKVPDSRAGIFKVRGLLTPTEMFLMGEFLRVVERHLSGGDGDGCIGEEDLESSFIEFLKQKKLSKKIIGIILYAIALADYDQENSEACNDLLKTKDGIKRLALYNSSIGRFPNAPGAMLYPMYGQGELPQAFCRRAAVKGCIHVLRMPVAALLTDKETGLYRGVRLASGQELFSQKLIMDPDVVVPQALDSSKPEDSEDTSNHSCSRDKGKVVRAICITKTSLKPDTSNILIVLPPRSLYPEQATTIRALQLSSNLAVCPAGMFVVHLSALCNDAAQGERLLTAAMDALFRQPTSGTANDSSAENILENSDSANAVQEEQRPVLEWRALYIQEITEGSVSTISTSPSPDGNLSYNDLVHATELMFQQMFPGEEFFPEEAPPEDAEEADPE